MPRHMLTLNDLGKETAWLLVQQAMGIPDAKSRSDFMAERTAVLIFAQESFPERLCVTAAIRQMGGFVVYADKHGDWHEQMRESQDQFLSIVNYYVDCIYTYGLPVASWNTIDNDVPFPFINAGSPDGHPAHALADLACMLRCSKDLAGVTAAWMGCANGTLHSLIEAAAYFPFSLRVSLPSDPDSDSALIKAKAAKLKVPVTFVDSPAEAVEGCDYIFAGCRRSINPTHMAAWRLDSALLATAAPKAKVLLSSSPVEAIPVDGAILRSEASLLARQAENRLRIHKRLLHWIFLENERQV